MPVLNIIKVDESSRQILYLIERTECFKTNNISYLKFTSGFSCIKHHLIITTTNTSTSPHRSFIARTNDLLKEMKAQLKEGTLA
jgi:hypothetical protein